MKGHFAEVQEVAPQYWRGVDHSSKGVVLVRSKYALLVWRRSGKCWAGIGMEPSYVAVRLQIVATDDPKSYDHIKAIEIFRGGRLRKDRIAAEIKKIREAMALPDLDLQHIDPKRTYVVEKP